MEQYISTKQTPFNTVKKTHNVIPFFVNAAASSLLLSEADQKHSLQRLKSNDDKRWCVSLSALF
jgi:hypothetical protein